MNRLIVYLSKAKYLKRWRGKDRRWHYKYAPNKDDFGFGSGGVGHISVTKDGKISSAERQGQKLTGKLKADPFSGKYGDGSVQAPSTRGVRSEGMPGKAPEAEVVHIKTLRAGDVIRLRLVSVPIYGTSVGAGGREYEKVVSVKAPVKNKNIVVHDTKVKGKSYLLGQNRKAIWLAGDKRNYDVSYMTMVKEAPRRGVREDGGLGAGGSGPKISAKERRVLSRAVQDAVKDGYYSDIPLENIDANLRKHGLLLIDEDDTQWSGMLIGSKAEANFRIGRLNESRVENGLTMYSQIKNAQVRMTWYKDDRRGDQKYEIVAYLT